MNVLHNILIRDGDTHIDGWNYTERITAPRPSCLELNAQAYRLRLSRMCIGDLVQCGDYSVSRVGTDKGRVKGYRILEHKLTLQEALAVVTGLRKLPTKPSLPLEDLPLFRKDAA